MDYIRMIPSYISMFTPKSLGQLILAFFNSLLIMFGSVFVGWGLLPNPLTVEPTVFVSENEYQIVWETKYPSAAWVTVDGERFTDSLAGSLVWDQNIHKVSVPVDRLDDAGRYEISWQHVMRDVIATEKGNHNAKTYSFRPIDFSDGLQIYNISDTHSIMSPGAETAGYWGDKLDLLILNGDIASDLLVPGMRTDIMRLAWAIAQGERPVLYARGNHETRGPASVGFHRYAGCPGEDRWYFTTRIGPLWIAVYDYGEDKNDGHVEYAGLVDFARYRERQTAFFDRVIANADREYGAEGVEYRLLVSHIPAGDEPAWMDQANQMGLDLALHGHWHSTQYYAPSEFIRNNGAPANYPVIIGSKPSHDLDSNDIFTATAVDIGTESIGAWFTNQNHDVVSTLPVIPRS
ncbi:MAG: metallophosphoesterase [Oscillospiraceae bacterium]|nr:metallophosphoesterase [Oscillospiraceae bacterium]